MNQFIRFLLFIVPFFSAFAEDLTIALNWKAEPQFGGFYEAQRMDPNLKLIQGGSGTPTLQMLLSGKVDFAIVSGDELVLSHSRGQTDLIALFAVYQKNPVAIMVHSTHPSKNLSELLKSTGSVLLWQEGLPYAQFLKKKHHPMKIKTAPYTGGIGLFQKDKNSAQQIFITAEPFLAQKKGLQVKTYLVADEGFNPYTTVLVARKSYYVTNKEKIQKLIQLSEKGWSAYLNDPEPTNKIIKKLNPSMDEDILKSSSQAQVDLIKSSRIGEMSPTRWQQLIDQMRDLKIIKAKPKVEDLFVSSTI